MGVFWVARKVKNVWNVSNSRPVNQDACYLTALNGTPLDVNSFAEPMG